MKTTDLITLQNSITQGEWTAVNSPSKDLIVQHCDDSRLFPPMICTMSRWQDAKLECEANARAIALVPSLIAEVIKLREALDKARRGFDYTVSSMAQGHTVSISSLQNCSALCRTALENT